MTSPSGIESSSVCIVAIHVLFQRSLKQLVVILQLSLLFNSLLVVPLLLSNEDVLYQLH